MKQLLFFLGMVVAGIFGYIAEPDLRARLTGVAPAAEVIHETVEIPVPAPTPTVPTIDLTNLSPAQLPEKVLVNTEVKVADSSSGLVMSIPAGSRVKLVRIHGTDAFVSPGEGPFVGKVAISDTDLMQQLAAKPPAPVAPAPAPEPPATTTPEPAAPITPTGESEEPAAATETPAVPEMTPAPETAPATETPAPDTATPATEGTPATPAAAQGNPDVVKAMQDSVKAAEIKEFTFDQVLEWKAEANEVVDGETYQTGIASYKAETIFGVKTIQAKALLKGGKVQRWVWLKSGMEIK